MLTSRGAALEQSHGWRPWTR